MCFFKKKKTSVYNYDEIIPILESYGYTRDKNDTSVFSKQISEKATYELCFHEKYGIYFSLLFKGEYELNLDRFIDLQNEIISSDGHMVTWGFGDMDSSFIGLGTIDKFTFQGSTLYMIENTLDMVLEIADKYLVKKGH